MATVFFPGASADASRSAALAPVFSLDML